MKILHLVQQYWPFRCGSARYFQLPSEYLVARGHEVTVFTTDALEYDYFLDSSKKRARITSEVHNGVSIVRFRTRHLPKSIRAQLHYRSSSHWAKCLFGIPFVPGLLLAALRRHEFDIVHGGILPYGILLFAAREIARRNRLPLIMTPCLHIGEPDDDTILKAHTDRYQIDMLRHADLLFAFTGLEKEKLAAYGIPRSRIEVLGDGVSLVDLEGGDGERFRERHGVSGPVVLFLGTKAFDKGTVHLIQAAESLWARGRRFTLVIAGSSANRDFSEFFGTCPPAVKERTRNLEDIGEEEKKDLLAAADVLAMPSRNDAFGVAYLEAWAYRKPVIGALAGGVPEVISDGEDGLLVSFGDVEALAGKMTLLLDDRELAAAMGERGHAKLAKKFAIERKCGRIETVYEQLCGMSRS